MPTFSAEKLTAFADSLFRACGVPAEEASRDIDQFAGAEHFLREVSGLAGNIKACPKADGAQEILVPGEPERRSRTQRRQSGIPLDDGTWKQLTALAEQLKVESPT